MIFRETFGHFADLMTGMSGYLRQFLRGAHGFLFF